MSLLIIYTLFGSPSPSIIINPNNLHVIRNLSILLVAFVELEQKTKLTNYWPVYGLADDVTTTSYHSHIIV